MSDAALANDIDGPGRGLIGLFAGSPVAANLLMALLLGGGVYAAMNLDVRNVPDFQTRQITVTVPYPGASPDEIEEEVNRRVEERLLTVKGVASVTSLAAEGQGVTTADVELFANVGTVLDDVRTAVERIEAFPPPLAEQPEIAASTPDIRVMTLAVSSQLLSGDPLRRAAEQVREDLLALPTVSLVTPFAAPEREIAIEASEEALRRHDMTLGDLASAVGRESVDVSSGELRTAAGGFVLSTRERRDLGAEFEDIVLQARADGTLLTVADVARVTDGFADTPMLTELNGDPAVFLDIDRTPEEGPLDIAAAVRGMLADYAPPAGVDVAIWDDQTRRIDGNIGELLANVFLGFVLVVVFLSLVFDLRISVWVAIGVPTAFLGACLLFPAFDVLISMVSLAALFLVIGIVVDDAVVVGESIASEQERGRSGEAAAIAGARAVRGPVVVGVLTTMVAFLPLLFVYGMVGQFMQVIPVVVVLVLAVSLAEAFFILPAHLSHSGSWSRAPLAGIQERMRGRLDGFRERLVVPAIAGSVRRPVTTIVVGAAVVLVAALLVATDAVRVSFVQHPPQADRVKADITFPPGTPFEVTREAADLVVDAAARVNKESDDPPIRTTATIVGAQFDLFSQSYLTKTVDTHLASVVAHLGADARDEDLDAVERLWREATGPIRGAESVEFGWVWEAYVPEVVYSLAHPDEAALAAALDALDQRLAALPGVIHTEHTLAPGKAEYEVELTPVGTAAGLTPRGLATQLRERFFGIEVQRIQRGRDEVVVAARYPHERRRSMEDLLNERVARPDGMEVPLTTVARLKETKGRAARMRIDGLPAASLTGLLDDQVTTAAEVREQIVPVLAELRERHADLRVLPAGTEKYQGEIMESLSYTVPLALAVIYVLIAILFRSYLMPLITLAAIPFAAAGAVIGHLALGYHFSIVSLFGVVAAGGVVVNDTLVLLDRYRKIRAEGDIPAVAAASAAARQRFRAIFLTTVTTVVGLLPMLYFSESLFFVPMVVSLMFGLIGSTVGILFLVPAVLLLVENFRDRALGRQTSASAQTA